MDPAAPEPARPRRRARRRSGLRTRRIAPGLGWYVVQEVTGEPVHQLGFQSPETAKGFEEHLAGLDGLVIDTLHSHLACADEDHPLNALQLERFRAAAASIPARRYSLANSAGICLGRDYAFDLVRPGLALYGGIPRAEAEGHIRPVAHLEAQVIQRRKVKAGESCGYGATFVADRDMDALVVNIGYADGYFRGFSNRGTARAGDKILPLLNARRIMIVEGPSAAELGAAVGRDTTAVVGVVDRDLARGIRAALLSDTAATP